LNNFSLKFLYFFAFVEGSVIMAIELSGAKMIGPAFGNSLYVWSITLATTMFSLAAGYFFGGFLLKKGKEPSKTLINLFLTLSVWMLLLPFIGRQVLYSSLAMNYLSGAFVSLFLILFPLLLIIGAASPILVQLAYLSLHSEKIGKVAGKIWSVSTFGGIIGAFIIGFILLPRFGIKITCVFIAFFSVIPVLFYHYKLRENKKMGIISVILLVGMILNLNTKPQQLNSRYKEIYKSDGLLGQLTIIDDKKYNGRKLLMNGISQSFMNIPTGRSQWKYVHRLAMYSSVKPEKSNVLLAGMGAGNLVNELVLLNFNVDVVDIDPRMEFVAKKYFGLKDDKIKSYVDDARHYIKTTAKKYDIIIYDLSSGENQPSNLYTLEGFTETKNILKPDGMLFLHSPGMLIHNSEGLKAIGNTLTHAGFNVKMLNTSADPKTTGEFIFYSTTSDFDLEKQNYSRQDPFSFPYQFPQKANVYLNSVDFKEGVIMTDDKPLLEYLQQENIKELRLGSNKETKEMIHNRDKTVF
jgi:predicted membrane-bound spermidine synthase